MQTILADKDIQGFIDYFGDELPNPDHYPLKVTWLMKWYECIVLKNRQDKENNN